LNLLHLPKRSLDKTRKLRLPTQRSLIVDAIANVERSELKNKAITHHQGSYNALQAQRTIELPLLTSWVRNKMIVNPCKTVNCWVEPQVAKLATKN